MTIHIKINNLPVELWITHYLPPQGLYGPSSVALEVRELANYIEQLAENS